MNIGLGFHAEMTLSEALAFIEVKDKNLTKYVKLSRRQSYGGNGITLFVGMQMN